MTATDMDASTQRTVDLCHRVGVTPLKSYKLTRVQIFVYKFLRTFRRRVLIPLLHLVDRRNIPNASLNLEVLWWKAINEQQQLRQQENKWTFDMLPPVIRRCIYFPLVRWIFNERASKAVELRTAYIDSILQNHIPKGFKSRLVLLGAGYDMRSIRLHKQIRTAMNLHHNANTTSSYPAGFDEAMELDLKAVVTAKQWLL